MNALWLRLSRLFVPLLAASCASSPNYLRDADAVNADLTINVVIENPAGSEEKWEVRADGRLVQESGPDGAPLQLPYLPWPVNAGMIPRTLLAQELGGDNEPCDVLVLGPALPRGSLARAVPIGLLRMLDRLERDDKVVAVLPGTPLGDAEDIEDLEERFPGVRSILETWYQHSRPEGSLQMEGFGSRAAARRLIAECAREFETRDAQGAMPTWGVP